jgi:hypothetical protein
MKCVDWVGQAVERVGLAATLRRRARATFFSWRSIARARGKTRPSISSKSSLPANYMKPPGTRTAMPTVRRSNSTEKRSLCTEFLQWRRAARACGSDAAAALVCRCQERFERCEARLIGLPRASADVRSAEASASCRAAARMDL